VSGDDGDRALPPPVEARLDMSLREYWLARVAQHLDDFYCGVPMQKFPEDLRVYEHLLWLARANVVIELGTHRGGSALWFRDRLLALHRYGRVARPLVISVDVASTVAREAVAKVDLHQEALLFVEGDVTDPELPRQVEERLPPHARCFVVEDTAHRFETTVGALRGFSRFVGVGSFFVVEDGCVDVEEMRLTPEWPRGVLPAVHEWLRSSDSDGFVVRRDLERYGISCHPEGFLERVR
jgi:cephalosporin hydroxylase